MSRELGFSCRGLFKHFEIPDKEILIVTINNYRFRYTRFQQLLIYCITLIVSVQQAILHVDHHTHMYLKISLTFIMLIT